MKIYHFTIIFSIFAAGMLLLADLTISENMYVRENIRFLDEICDRAANAGAGVLAESGKLGVYGVREAAVDTFYKSLAASLNLAGYANSRNSLRLYVPVILVTDEIGTYVCYDDYEKDAYGSTSLVRKWSDNLNGSDLEDILQYYCTRHNSVAERAGLKYEFTLPPQEGGMYLRGCDGTGFYAVFQGYPVRGTEEVYNRFSFAGTGLGQVTDYYINLSGTGYASPMYFHRENCPYRSDESRVYNSRSECALAGAFECPECGGDGY